jgi:hypothetical protein
VKVANILHSAAGSVVGWHNEARIYRLAEHLHGLGPRAVGEALIGEAAASGNPEATLGRLAQFTRTTRQEVASVGADRPLRPRLKVAP